MSLRKNILASYASQIYVTLIGIVMVPVYVKYMGVEAYGLVGIFAMLQALFQLLDIGLTPTMARETARFNGGATDALSLRRLLRMLECVFVGVAVVGATLLAGGADIIAVRWLKVEHLPLAEVAHAIQLMALIVALRWVCGLYRGAINGFERQIWLGGFNATIATARFVVVIPMFIYVGTSPTHFFVFQLLVATAELIWLAAKTYSLLPRIGEVSKAMAQWDWKPLRSLLGFALSISATNLAWVLVTQTDKLVLSNLLPLTEYAYFTLAVLMASGVQIASAPLGSVLMSRMARLVAEQNQNGLIELYRSATRLITAILAPVVIVLALYSDKVLLAWTGNALISKEAAPILTLYALGNGILALTALPYYLQYAKGELKLHVIGNIIFIFLLIPALVWAVDVYGAVGAGYAWLVASAIFFTVWIPRIHALFAPGLHLKWLLVDIGVIMLISIIVAMAIDQLITWPTSRVMLVIYLSSVGALLCAATFSYWIGPERIWAATKRIGLICRKAKV